MLRSLYAGVSGIKNHQTKLDILGNNIANINTVGFKGSRLTFADTFNQTINSNQVSNNQFINGKQIGLGVGTSSVQTLFNQGMLEATGNITDLAIQGNSFFVLNDNGNQVYSRDGSFHFDANRNLVNNTGMAVRGWMADSFGQVSVSETLDNIQIDTNMISSPIATQNLRLSGNLSSSNSATSSVWQLGESMDLTTQALETDPNAQISTDTLLKDVVQLSSYFNGNVFSMNLSGSKLSDGSSPSQTSIELNENSTIADLKLELEAIFTDSSVTFTGSNQIEIRDNQSGNSETEIQIAEVLNGINPIHSSFGNDATSVSGSAVIYDSLGEAHNIILKFTPKEGNEWAWQVETTENEQIISGGSGTVNFNSNGNIIANSFSFNDTEISSLTINDGQTNLSINIDVDGHNGISGLSANGLMSTLSVFDQDGRATGTFENMYIENSGNVIAQFTNGDTRTIAQIATAIFKNPSGLEKAGGNSFMETNASGNVSIDSAINSNSSIVSGALEMSNVDLANEFTDMIVSQRGFQASTKVVSTSDQILEEAINLKR
ncbi:MAG: flagellar hook-basal body complex protein [Candidatus Marinimicrobia bacterium]|nr:flagellar hook-basal body complex protein [Candidatus Neomarinimicrobiota bacterium]